MRRLITALLACLLLIATTADRLVCADGCTDESPVQATTPHASAPCAFCQGWRPSPAVVAPIPTFFVVATVPPLTTYVLAPALPTLELPPKSA